MKRTLNKLVPLAFGAFFNLIALFSRKQAAKKAFNLFCTPRKGKVRPEQQEFLEQAKSQRIKVKDLELQAYEWKGSNETVLLLHGWESNAFRWRNLISYLNNEDYNIVAFDAPAHGNSTGTILNVPLYTECTEAIVDYYKPQIVIGHSVGGMNTLYHHEKYPNDQIKKIVTIGSPSKLQDIMEHYQQLLKFNDSVFSALDDYFKDYFGFRIHEFSTSTFTGHLSKRGLVIHDEEDSIAPFKASESVHANWENSTFYKTKGLGHSMHQGNVNLEIMRFLKS
ncbi:alpha/beta fold hydrolase [Maribacter sp. HTCC2170]|uniref:alpha/beta fold hydrolase n=1 Tax=Maribacter sp. (strain HTCC2170 / KCCM 42371) TaxID=313603 RepID=UPI00006BD28C|nr:alpha/beta hydrolase [Maribacter sp. HTCC2170]EAR02069.1 hydrolase, putative [Maribacter sp. HTCC2170]